MKSSDLLWLALGAGTGIFLAKRHADKVAAAAAASTAGAADPNTPTLASGAIVAGGDPGIIAAGQMPIAQGPVDVVQTYYVDNDGYGWDPGVLSTPGWRSYGGWGLAPSRARRGRGGRSGGRR